jgi:hypothetical protein
VQSLDALLVDDSYHSEIVPSLRLKASALNVNWSTESTDKMSDSADGTISQPLSSRCSFIIRSSLSCNYFNSSLDVEEAVLQVSAHPFHCLLLPNFAFTRVSMHADTIWMMSDMQEWPISFKFDQLPIENVKVISATSEEIMMMRLSPACMDSFKDAVKFADCVSLCSPMPTEEQHIRYAKPSKPHGTHSSHKYSFSGKHADAADWEAGQMFKLLNSTGLGLACYTCWTDPSQRVDVAATAHRVDLQFQPKATLVHLPDLARKVLFLMLFLLWECSCNLNHHQMRCRSFQELCPFSSRIASLVASGPLLK